MSNTTEINFKDLETLLAKNPDSDPRLDGSDAGHTMETFVSTVLDYLPGFDFEGFVKMLQVQLPEHKEFRAKWKEKDAERARISAALWSQAHPAQREAMGMRAS